MIQDVRHREYRMKSADANLHSLQTRKICFSRKNKTVLGLFWHLIGANTVRLPMADLDPRAEMNPSLTGTGF